MFKSIYEFTKIFSVLFFLMAIFFTVKGMMLLGGIALISLIAVQFSNSDWAFDNFKFQNHNMFVMVVTFSMIFLNLIFIYKELCYSPIFVKANQDDQENYIVYENSLYSAIAPCVKAHNDLMYKKASSQNNFIAEYEVKNANSSCYHAVDEINEQKIPEELPENVKDLCFSTKNHFRKIAINLATYSYTDSTDQSALTERIRENVQNSIQEMSKIRVMMHFEEDLSDDKKNFINL